MSSDPSKRLEELQAQIATRKAAIQARVNPILRDAGDNELPQLEELRDERERLRQEIQRQQQEVDYAMQSFDSEGQMGDLFRVAARVQRFEKFADHAAAYAKGDLADEVCQVADADRRNSDNEVAAYITSLQSKREEELKKITALKEKTKKRAIDIRNTPKVNHGSQNARLAARTIKEEELDKDTKTTMEYTSKAKGEKVDLISKVKELRQEKTKLQVELLDEKHRNERRINELQTGIRQAGLANTRDVRICQQLNSGNAALTTNAQILLSQLNVEHYGMGGGPTEKMLIQMSEEQKREAARKEKSQANKSNGTNVNEEPQFLPMGTYADGGGASQAASRRQSSASKPPLVALKRTESQRSREAAVRADAERRRDEEGSAAGSHHSNRGMSPMQKRHDSVNEW